MKKFISWVGGIAAAVLSAVLISHFNQPPSPITFEGMVIDQIQNVPLHNAKVSFEVEQNPSSKTYHDFTDEHGSYKLPFDGLSKASKVIVSVHANGFHDPQPVPLDSLNNSNRVDFELSPLSTPNPTLKPRPATPPSPLAQRPKYIPKLPVQAIRIAPVVKH